MSPKVECIKNQRYKYFFHSNDHEPPHVHVRRSGEWEVKVMFITCEEDFLHYKFAVPASRKTPLTSSEQKEILHDILPVKDELYKEWVRKVRTS